MLNTTQKRLVYTQPGYNIYHYHQKAPITREPLFIVFSLLNTPWVLDLHPSRSMIQQLLAEGLDIYVLEWQPNAQQCLAQLILTDLANAIEVTTQIHGTHQLHVLGICQGGYFSLILSALNAKYIASVIPMVTPIDFSGIAQHFSQVKIAELVEPYTDIPGILINIFLQHVDFNYYWQSKRRAWQACGADPQKQAFFYTLENWAKHCPNQSKRVFLEFVERCVQENQLIRGVLELRNQTVSLSQLTLPIFNIYATQDYLWPPQATRALAHFHQSEHYQEYAFHGGHIGVMVSERALYEIPPLIKNWILQHNSQADLDYVEAV